MRTSAAVALALLTAPAFSEELTFDRAVEQHAARLDAAIAERQATLDEILRSKASTVTVEGKKVARSAAANALKNEIKALERRKQIDPAGKGLAALPTPQQIGGGVRIDVGQVWVGRRGSDLRLEEITDSETAVFRIEGIFAPGRDSVGKVSMPFVVRGIDTSTQTEDTNSRALEGRLLFVAEKKQIDFEGRKTTVVVMDAVRRP